MNEQRLKGAGTEPAQHRYPRLENEQRASGGHLSDLRQEEEKVQEDKALWVRSLLGASVLSPFPPPSPHYSLLLDIQLNWSRERPRSAMVGHCKVEAIIS